MRWSVTKKYDAVNAYRTTGRIPEGFSYEEIRYWLERLDVYGTPGLKATKVKQVAI